MPPRQHHVVETTMGLVDAILGRIHGVVRIGVALEGVRVDDFVRELAPNNEGVLVEYRL